MNCPDTGTWQAYLDGEIPEQERGQFLEHAQKCPRCAKTLAELSQLEDWTGQHLMKYGSALDEMMPKQDEHKRFQLSHVEGMKKVDNGGQSMTRKFKKWAMVAASLLVLAGSLTFAPVQEAVADFLSVFRVQKMQMIKVSPDEMQQMARAIETKAGEIDLKQFGKVEVIKKPEQVEMAPADIQNQLSFKVKQPSFIPEGYSLSEKAKVQQDGKAEFRLEVDQANALLKALGSATLLPESLQGKAFSIHVPAGVQLQYLQNDGQRGFTLNQFATPEVVVPSGVDPEDLRAALLDLPILPDDLRNQLASIDDWQNTMIVPDAGQDGMEKMTVNGQDAIYAQNNQGLGYLMWVDNGVIYQLNGFLDSENAVKVAQSLY